MAINVAEITSVLKREISNFEQKVQVSEVGTVIEVGDGIARVYGLRGAMAGELLEFENGTMGQVFNLEEDSIGSVVFMPMLATGTWILGQVAAEVVADYFAYYGHASASAVDDMLHRMRADLQATASKIPLLQ